MGAREKKMVQEHLSVLTPSTTDIADICEYPNLAHIIGARGSSMFRLQSRHRVTECLVTWIVLALTHASKYTRFLAYLVDGGKGRSLLDVHESHFFVSATVAFAARTPKRL